MPEVASPDDPQAPRSLLDELRQDFAQATDEERLFKRLPTKRAKGRIAVEYRLLKFDEAGVLSSPGTVDFDAVQDTLIKATVQLHWYDPADERADAHGLVPLHVALGIETVGPLQYDKRLTDALGIDFGTAREILLGLFDGNELALSRQYGELGAWSTDTTQEHYQDFVAGS